MPTISILLRQKEERVICSFSCSDVKINDMFIVGEGYIGVAQSYFTEENTQDLSEYVCTNGTIEGYDGPDQDYRQYGFVYDDHYETYHGEKCLGYYGHHYSDGLMLIGNRVKNEKVFLSLFKDLKSSEGSAYQRITESLSKNKVVGFDSECEQYGISCSSISYIEYNKDGSVKRLIEYVGKDMDPIDVLLLPQKTIHKRL